MGLLLLKLNERHLLFLKSASAISLIHLILRKFFAFYFPQIAHPFGLFVLRKITESYPLYCNKLLLITDNLLQI